MFSIEFSNSNAFTDIFLNSKLFISILRLNSLLEIVTFGKVAGINASNKSKEIEYFDILNLKQFSKDEETIQAIYSQVNSENFYLYKKIIGDNLFENLGLFRNENNMCTLLNELNKIKDKLPHMGIGDKSKEFNKNLVEFIEFKNILDISIITTISAIHRKESRGGHYRTDYPMIDKNLDKCSLVIKEEDKIKINFEEIK